MDWQKATAGPSTPVAAAPFAQDDSSIFGFRRLRREHPGRATESCGKCCAHGDLRLRRGEGVVSCQNLFAEIGFKGGGPDAAQIFKGSRDKGFAVDVNKKSFSAGGSDAGCEETEFAGKLFDG